MIFLLVSCVHQVPLPKSIPSSYHLAMKGEFQDTDQLLAMSLDVDLSVVPLERHSDDSVSYRIQVQEARSSVQGQEQDWKLVGKYVIARAFESGELLSIQKMEEWGEESPYIDAFDTMWFVLFPNPPNITKNEEGMSMARYPLAFSTEEKAFVRVRSFWKLGTVSTTASLMYKGETRIKGTWRELTLSGDGEISGTLESRIQGGIPIKNEGVHSRSFCYEGTIQKCQKQSFTYSLTQKP